MALAKLAEVDVLEIRRLYAAGGISQRKLAKEFGVSKSLIGYIVSRTLWAHVPLTGQGT